MEELERALDDCLQQLASGRMSLAQCLARYPKYAAELRPLLETALRLQKGKRVRPSGPTRDHARAEVTAYTRSHPRGKQPKHGSLPKVATGLLVLALAVFFACSAFAQDALPGQFLYSLKLTTERAWRDASTNPVSADLMLSARRTHELIRISSQQSSNAQVMASEKSAEVLGLGAYKDVLDRLATDTDGPAADEVLTRLQEQQHELANAGIHVPELDDIVARGKAGKNQAHGSGKP